MGLKLSLCVASSINKCLCPGIFHSANTKVLKVKLLTKWEKVGGNGAKW